VWKIVKPNIQQNELKVLTDLNANYNALFRTIKYLKDKKMQKEIPDNIVYSKEQGYNASFLPYATSVGAPIIKVDDVAAWKGRGVRNVNKEFENKFNETAISKFNGRIRME
jgi:hypothetical protein